MVSVAGADLPGAKNGKWAQEGERIAGLLFGGTEYRKS